MQETMAPKLACNCDESFISKNLYPVRSPLSSEKYAASGFEIGEYLLNGFS